MYGTELRPPAARATRAGPLLLVCGEDVGDPVDTVQHPAQFSLVQPGAGPVGPAV